MVEYYFFEINKMSIGYSKVRKLERKLKKEIKVRRTLETEFPVSPFSASGVGQTHA